MRTLVSSSLIAALSGLLWSATPALSQTSEEFAAKGRIMWSSFQCSTYAERMENTEAQARHFQHGLEAGRTFLEAARAGDIEPEDARSTLPIAVSFRMQGPTPDFILGRIFEAASGMAYENVDERTQTPSDEELRLKAQATYRDANCELIGGR